MPALHLHGVSHAYTSATPVIRDADLHLAADAAWASPWVGVVGPNGSGKSTLLRLLAGRIAPTSGRVQTESVVPPRLVEQHDELDAEVVAFAGSWDGGAERLRRRLELDPDDLDPATGRGWNALSPGMRRRWQVAAALSEQPDVLLLDEPTNHMDASTRALLIDALRGFVGVGLVVSHDRLVLEQLTTRTLRLHRHRVELHAGAYAEASARWQADEAAGRAAHRRARGEVDRQQRILADVRRDRHSAEVAPRRERRLAGAAQPDAREAGRRIAQQKAERALGRRVTQMNARLERAGRVVDDLDVRREVGGPLAFRHTATGRRILCRVTGDVPHGGGQTWLRDVDVALHRGERVHLAGANGAGKTSLLDAVVEQLIATDEVVAVLPQLDDPRAILMRARALTSVRRGELAATAAALGVDPARLLATDAPSPGEARKLALAELLVSEAGVLVLDEPTNHLDLPSIQRLQQALEDWPGALLLVTHDDALAAAVATTRWTVQQRRVRAAAAEELRQRLGSAPGGRVP